MKIGGVEVTKCEEVLVLPRIEGDLVFRAEAVASMDEFDDLCPRPKPPVRLTKDGKETHESEDFLNILKEWSERRYAYICVNSLRPSEIEWETVDYEKPGTWKNWSADLRKAGLADTELNRVQALVLDANALNEAKLKEAREAFLRGQGTQA